MLIDSGCTHSLIPKRVYDELANKPELTPVPENRRDVVGFNGAVAQVLGECMVDVSLPGRDYTVKFIVLDAETLCILGVDFMERADIQFEWKHNMIWCRQGINNVDQEAAESQVPEVFALGEHEIPAECEMALPIRIEGIGPGSTVLVEGTMDTTVGGIVVGSTLLNLSPTSCDRVRVMNPHKFPIRIRENAAIGTASLATTVDSPYPLLEGEVAAAVLDAVSVEAALEIVRKAEAAADRESESGSESDNARGAEVPGDLSEELPEHLVKLYKEATRHVPEELRPRVAHLIQRFQDTFVKSSIEMGLTNVGEHKIDTGDAEPVRDRPRRIPLHKRPMVEQKVKEMLEVGVIQPSESPWSACPVLVTKPDGSIRWCVDWRKLNQVTIKDRYPLPRIEDCLEAMEGAEWFSSLDLQHGYWQIPLRRSDWQKTAFTTHIGLYEFTRTPMGVSNAPATFQRLMERVLNGLDLNIAVIYIDDVVVPGNTFDQAVERLDKVLSRLEASGLKVKTKKCHLFQKSVEFLGHQVGIDGIRPTTAKIIEVNRWSAPKNVSTLKGFLGFVNYYRKMIKDFAKLAAPLNKLLKKDATFEWSVECQQSFDLLKEALTAEPVMAFPRPVGKFILDTDACNVAWGAVLSQEQDGVERVIAYQSKAWSPAERNYSTTRQELLAALLGMESFRYYLLGLPDFTLRTDHACLKWLETHKSDEGLINRWWTRMSAFNFTVVHRPGRQHGNADGLSRRPCPGCGEEAHPDEWDCRRPAVVNRCALVKTEKRPRRKRRTKPAGPQLPMPEGDSVHWTPDMVLVHQKADKNLSMVYEWLEAKGRPAWDDVSPRRASLKYWWHRFESLRIAPSTKLIELMWVTAKGETKWRIIIPKSLQSSLLHEWHASVTGGHMGSNKTWGRAKSSGFYWSDMRHSVREYVRGCLICAARKPANHGKQNKLVKMNPGHKFEMVGMDLIGPLPLSKKENRYILTVTDYWTRWCDAYPIPDKASATVAEAFMSRWVTQHGTPLSILSDQGGEFCSALFRECCKLMDSWKMRTTPFHPRCNGLTERLNQTIERMLSAFVAEHQEDWDERLPFVMMAYRSAVQESTGVSPYTMLYGDDMPVPLDWVFKNPRNAPEDKILYVKELRGKINSAYEHARKCLLSAIARQKRNYDRGVRNITFRVGEFVMCHDKTKKIGRNPALGSKWRGPYVIIRKLNIGTAVIQLAEGQTPLTVHVDRLKHCFPPDKNKYRWALEYLIQANPNIQNEWSEGQDMSSSEDEDVRPAAVVPAGAAMPSDIDGGSGFSSLCDPEVEREVENTMGDVESNDPDSAAVQEVTARRRKRVPVNRRRRAQPLGTQLTPTGQGPAGRKPRVPGGGSNPDREVAHQGNPDIKPPQKTRGGRVIKQPKRLGIDSAV